jgi:hypothetical protein
MRLIFAFISLLFVLTTSSTLAESDDTRPNGLWWSEMSAVVRLAAVVGAISAYKEAYAAGQLSIPQGKNKTFPRSPDFPHTYGYYVEAVTDFYTLHPERKTLELGVVLECLSDQPPPKSIVPCP